MNKYKRGLELFCVKLRVLGYGFKILILVEKNYYMYVGSWSFWFLIG